MTVNIKTVARSFSLQFLYQCEAEKLLYYSEPHFETFAQHFKISGPVTTIVKEIAKGVFDHLDKIDSLITKASKNWSITRMLSTDRIVMRIAVYELLETSVPTKVAINEAIELAKRFGSEGSGTFVNGILDAVAKELRSE